MRFLYIFLRKIYFFRPLCLCGLNSFSSVNLCVTTRGYPSQESSFPARRRVALPAIGGSGPGAQGSYVPAETPVKTSARGLPPHWQPARRKVGSEPLGSTNYPSHTRCGRRLWSVPSAGAAAWRCHLVPPAGSTATGWRGRSSHGCHATQRACGGPFTWHLQPQQPVAYRVTVHEVVGRGAPGLLGGGGQSRRHSGSSRDARSSA